MEMVFTMRLLLIFSWIPMSSASAPERHVGCYEMSTLQEAIDNYPVMSHTGGRVGLNLNTAVEDCRTICLEHSATFYGLKRTGRSTNYVKCFYGNQLPPSIGRNCNYTCSGVSCGGSENNMSVYSVCPAGYYGYQSDQNCTNRCHCLHGNTCSLADGRCSEGCEPGWTGSACNRDVDECAEKNAGCAQRCVNKSPGFTCDCRKGYRLESDQKTCSDIDECEEDNSTCKLGKEQCWNTEGSSVCCPNGTNYDRETDVCKVHSAAYGIGVTIGCAVAGCAALVAIVILSVCLNKSRKSSKKNKARLRLSMSLPPPELEKPIETPCTDTYLTPVSLPVPPNNKLNRSQLVLPLAPTLDQPEDRYVSTPTSQTGKDGSNSNYATIDDVIGIQVPSSRSLTREEAPPKVNAEVYIKMDRRGSQELLDSELKEYPKRKDERPKQGHVY